MSEFADGATTPETEATATTEATTTTETVTTEPVVNEWVGEGKKYKTVDDLASAYKSADQRLEELKLDNERLISEAQVAADKSKGVQDVLDAINGQQQTTSTEQTTTAPPGVSAEQIQEIVNSQLVAAKTEATRDAAIKNTWAAMDESFGGREAASQAVKEYIGGDESKKAIVNSMAISDSTGLLKLLGKEVKPTTFTTDHSVRTSVDNVDVTGPLTWDIAHAVRDKDPKTYYSPAFRKRMSAEL